MQEFVKKIEIDHKHMNVFCATIHNNKKEDS